MSEIGLKEFRFARAIEGQQMNERGEYLSTITGPESSLMQQNPSVRD